MNNARFLAALLLALPLAAQAQTKTKTSPAPAKTTQPPAAVPKPAAGTQQVTEVTEDLDPATGKVIRRTTRTYTPPADSPATAASGSAGRQVSGIPSATRPAPAAPVVAEGRATDAQVTAFLRRKTSVFALSAPALVNVYAAFIERVRTDRHAWKTSDWTTANNVLTALNARYDQLRTSFSFDDKLTIRADQAEFQALRTTRQLSDQVSDKL